MLYIDSADSFGMIRGGHMDVAILGVRSILLVEILVDQTFA